MADPGEGDGGGGGTGSLLARKWGPMPVWAWALIGLAVAWGIAKYRSTKAAAAAAADATNLTTADGQAVAPQFVIENNMPFSPSAPVTVPAGPPAPVVTPPGTAPGPPVVKPPAPPAKKPPAKAPAPKGKAKAGVYRVVSGDTLSSIAAKHGTTAQKLFTYNTTPGNRPAATIALLKSRGPNLIFPGEEIDIPQS